MPGKSHVLTTKISLTRFRFPGSTFPLSESRFAVLRAVHQRQYATSTDISAPSIGILGGGITGLATAYYILKERPKAQVTIYEKSSRVGGWIHSPRVDVPGGSVLFETGSRSLRTGDSGRATYSLISQLGLQNDVLFTGKTSPSARNRFIYYPDHLVLMPGPAMSLWENIMTLWKEPVFEGFLSSVFLEPTVEPRSTELEDESVGAFLSRRFRPELANNLASALYHGIYAGDVWQLSVKSILPRVWAIEDAYGGLLLGLAKIWPKSYISYRDLQLKNDIELGYENLEQEFRSQLSSSSIFTFRDGIEQLVNRLGQAVQKMGVKIQRDTVALSVKNLSVEDKISICTAPGSIVDQYTGRASNGVQDWRDLPQIVSASLQGMADIDKNAKQVVELTTETKHDYIISTIFSRDLSLLAVDPNDPQFSQTLLPSLLNQHAVTVMVVSLYFSNPELLPISGFGYLLPQSTPFDQNPERALGVVFDSNAVQNQDTVLGTKLTVMLGGHYWDGWTSYPSHSEGVEMARSILKRHLNIEEHPAATNVALQRDCIPQYTVGHERRMRIAHGNLVDNFEGRLKVAGNSYTGVSVHDCIRGARDMGKSFGSGKKIITGLDHFSSSHEMKWHQYSPERG